MSVSSANPPKCGIASESDVAQDVIDALNEEGFVSIRRDFWKHWCDRKDLFDSVVMRDIEFIIGFIKQVDYAQERILAALFVKRPDEVDKVLKRIEYNDKDLFDLIAYRLEIRESHDGLLNLVEMIENPEYQKEILEDGIKHMFKIKKHASVIPFINALVCKRLKNRKLTNVAIRRAFGEGTRLCLKEIVEEFYDHPTITHEEYADGLSRAWHWDESEVVLPFLVSRADKGDWEEAENKWDNYSGAGKICRFFHKGSKKAPPAGTRHNYFGEKVKEAITTLNYAMSTKVWRKKSGKIIEPHLVDEKEWMKRMDRVKQMNAERREMKERMMREHGRRMEEED